MITIDHLIAFLTPNTEKPAIGAKITEVTLCGMGMTIQNTRKGKVVGIIKKPVYDGNVVDKLTDFVRIHYEDNSVDEWFVEDLTKLKDGTFLRVI